MQTDALSLLPGRCFAVCANSPPAFAFRAPRGYGARRVEEELRAAGIAQSDREQADAQTRRDAWSAADRFARRKRLGPYAVGPLDPRQREKAIGAFLRAGHDYALARRWVDAAPGQEMVEEE